MKKISTIFLIALCAGCMCACSNSAEETINQTSTETSEILSLPYEAYRFNLENECTYFEGIYSDEEMGDYTIDFSASINEFSEVMIGKGKGQFNGMYLSLTNDSLSVIRCSDNSIAAQFGVDYDIRDYVNVTITTNMTDSATIEIETADGGGEYTAPWSARIGMVFAESGPSTVMENCQLSYNAECWNKPIWLMGDSYFNCVSPARWTSYLTTSGYNNFLLNGYSGRGSDAALASLKNMLRYATPEEIIWCLGMNDKDNDDSINESWQADLEEVIAICNEQGIELVLCTIPNCPSFNNSYKNEYVRESGYRYIDFASAVGADYDSEWYNGMLEDIEEPVHPTTLGAQALYEEAISVCPELLDIAQ